MTRAERVAKYKIWLKALRSGEWKQSRGKYHGRNGGHCCLGVGQIVLGLPKEESAQKLGKLMGLPWGNREDKRFSIKHLISLNDDGHRNFAYIANQIEKYILTHFLTK